MDRSKRGSDYRDPIAAYKKPGPLVVRPDGDGNLFCGFPASAVRAIVRRAAAACASGMKPVATATRIGPTCRRYCLTG
jgi:hypothetical protein